MVTFLLCFAALVGAYFVYGRFLERVCAIDGSRATPAVRLADGVDYVRLPRWKIFLVQLLNIAGLGPIFGAVLGAAFGPVAFLWITLGGILMGGMHDFLSGVISLRHDGQSLPELVGHYLGRRARLFMSLFTVLLLVLVGAVFMSQPAELIVRNFPVHALEGAEVWGRSADYLLFLGIICIYYVVATLLPVDKIIGRLYPLFGAVLLVMAGGILFVLLFRSGRYAIPELTSLRNLIADAEHMPVVPMLFTTIACGALSGFHATQSPLMARCIADERDCRSIFYGAMIAESLIALIWAAIGMAFWGGVGGLNEAIAAHRGSAALLVDAIATETLGRGVATFVICGVIACAVTSGDTAFRSARLVVADFLGVGQRGFAARLAISLPLFAAALWMIFGLPFQTIWSYFAWTNQTLAVVTLWMICVWLARHGGKRAIALLPALFMTYVCSSYVFVSPLMCGMANRAAAYGLAAAATLLLFLIVNRKIRHDATRRA